MKQFMVVETFRARSQDKIYQRFHRQGRMLPRGLEYIDSWLGKDGRVCFQLMQTENLDLFAEWIKHWEDLCEFDIIELGDKPVAAD